MSDQFWKRLSYIFGLLMIGVLFGLIVFLTHIEIGDLDLWLHMGVGDFIRQAGYVPDVDVLSSTIAGKPWNNHEWLFQILVSWIYEIFGTDGLSKMQAALVWATMLLLLFLGYTREKQFGPTFILLLVLMVYQTRFTFRPDLFSLLFFTIYIYILSIYIDRRWSLYVLFFIQVLWSNFHGFFFFGPLFVLIAIAAEWLKRNVRLPYEWNNSGRLTDDEYWRIKLVLVAVVLACFINPQVFKGAIYPIQVLFQISGESRVFFDYIQELQRPIQWGNIFDVGRFPFYKLLIFLSFISFIFNRRKIDVGVLTFWLIFLGFSLSAVRNMPFFALAAYLVFVTNTINLTLNDVLPFHFTNIKFKYLVAVVFKLMIMIWMLEYGINMSTQRYFDFDKFDYKSIYGGVSLKNYPYKAVDFLVENNIKGRTFNDFNSGAYLIGRTFPNIKVFIDGRTEVYGPEFFKTYQEIWEKGNVKLFDKVADHYDLTMAFMNSATQPIPDRILLHLYNDETWKIIYFDFDAIIFLKDIPENKEYLERFYINMPEWKPEKFDLLKLGPRSVTPYQHMFRAYSLQTLGLYEQALQQSFEAVKINPQYAAPYKIIGKIYGKAKEYNKAYEYFRVAAMFDPGNFETRYNLARAYLDLEDFERAIEQYQAIIERKPNDPKGHFHISRAYIKNTQYDEAMDSVKKAHQLSPSNGVDLLILGDLFYEHKEYEKAKGVFEMGATTKHEPAKMQYKLGLTLQALGEAQKAREAFEQGLSINPEDEDLKKALKKIGRMTK